MNRDELIRLVVTRALRGDESLSVRERMDLYQGLSLLLPEDEGEAIRTAAFLLREAENASVRIREIFNIPPEGKEPPSA